LPSPPPSPRGLPPTQRSRGLSSVSLPATVARGSKLYRHQPKSERTSSLRIAFSLRHGRCLELAVLGLLLGMGRLDRAFWVILLLFAPRRQAIDLALIWTSPHHLYSYSVSLALGRVEKTIRMESPLYQRGHSIVGAWLDSPWSGYPRGRSPRSLSAVVLMMKTSSFQAHALLHPGERMG
jgi:hypothetical protein